MRVPKTLTRLAALGLCLCLARGAASQPAPPPTGSGGAAPAPVPSAAPVGPAASASPASPASRGNIPRAPDPTPEQLEALEVLRAEASSYEADAKDYRATITRIIKHHYSERRRRVLSALDAEIGTEQAALDEARGDAIKRLETFVAKYSGPNADEKETPDAMFRLAALYEERSKAKIKPGDTSTIADFSDTVRQYKQILLDFPKYAETAAVYYYLGHAYFAMGRLEESQQVWRSLVCHNHFDYRPSRKDLTKDEVAHLPQDHEPAWWDNWRQRHPRPEGAKSGGQPKPPRTGPQGDAGRGGDNGDEMSYLEPFPEDCTPIPQKTLPDEEPRYIAEIWWQIGDYHFEEVDPWGGPYNLNRAESAYRHSMRFKKPPVFGVAMYKLAWTFYKQQRYETAVRQFVELLDYTDLREKETGDPGADFRNEAYAYIAGSLTFQDFQGPTRNEPYIGRDDLFDLETDAAVIEKKMHVAIDRVQDPKLIPQDRKWTAEVYRALANEFKEYNYYANLIETDELILSKWPMNRNAPKVQNRVAETYQTLADQTPPGPQRDAYSKKALEARGALARYVGKTDWTEANKEDPEAIREAEHLVRGGLRRAAADYTNAGSGLIQTALNSTDKDTRELAFEAALDKYRRASEAWRGYLEQDETADDAYDSRYWLADALTNVVVIQVAMHRMPSEDDFKEARRRAVEVRDSNESNEKLQPAAMMAVKVAQQRVLINYYLNEDGKGGFPKLTALETQGTGESAKFIVKSVPPEIEGMIGAFDDYIGNVPPDADPYGNHEQFAYTSGETYFFYGQFEQAKKRLTPIYLTQCGKTKYGYLAWERLLTMANQERDIDRGRELALAAEKQSCAFDEETKRKEQEYGQPTIVTGYYVDAARAFTKAEGMPPGKERDEQYRKAAQLYEDALAKAPAHDKAPEAAMNGAYCWKKVDEYDKAIAMYRLFIDAYGSEEKLAKLEKGDNTVKPPLPPNPKLLEERVANLKAAYDELGKSYIQFFSYRTAAETFQAIAKNTRFKDDERRDAAENAVTLFGNVGDRDKMREAKALYFSLAPPEEDKARISWLEAESDFQRWNERGADTGPNKDARLAAQASMEAYYRQHNNNSAAHQYTVIAAYNSAKLRRIAEDPTHKEWCKRTIDAFKNFDKKGTPQAEMAAECKFRDLDDKIKKTFDYDAGFHHYEGVVTDVMKKYKEDVEVKAKELKDELQRDVITAYGLNKWAVAARVRQGTLYDSCRTGLYNASEPGLKLYTVEEEKKLKEADQLCENDGNEKACALGDNFRAKRRATWKTERDAAIAAADQPMSMFYAEGIVWARQLKVHVDAVDHAVRRLAFFTDIVGDAKLRQYLSGLKALPEKEGDQPQPVPYEDGMYMRMRRGMTAQVEGKVLPDPLPAPVQGGGAP
ncbi:MAG: hypothetical protein IT373_00350 [Polyangiaceae bacterium]|nr:hypothetical protein [Polyangiaceae bacterium]